MGSVSFSIQLLAQLKQECFLNDVPHGWREVFDEGGNLLTRELYDNGNIIKIKGK